MQRILNINNLRGVDLTSSPIKVASNRASYMRNMINKNGVNVKRNGWVDFAFFSHEGNTLPINGVFDYNDKFIVHAGTHFYCCNKDFGIENELKIKEGTMVVSSKSKGYVQNGKLWIVGAGEYLVYDGDIVQPVLESMYAYIPTTSIGITALIEGGKTTSFQGVNLFTKKRINKLVGVTNKVEGTHIDGLYRLDGMIDFDYPVKLKLETAVEKLKLTYNVDGEQKTEELSGKACVTVEHNKGEKIVTTTIDDDDASKFLELKIICCDFYNDGKNGYVKFGHILSTPILEGDSNISVEYTAKYNNEIEISGSNIISVGAGVDVLCLANMGNVVYFSDFLYGYGYFPDNDFIGIGDENRPITAIVQLTEGIGVFKATEFYKVNIAVNIIDEKMVVRLEPSIIAYYPDIGCINEFACRNVNGDTLFYNSKGVYGVTSSITNPVNKRSTNVDKGLSTCSNVDRLNSFAISYDGKYCLFIDDKIYIADARFKVYESNRLDTGFEYEWWVWDNCKCRCAFVVNENLYMGTENGRIRSFTDGYEDVKKLRVSASNNEFNCYEGQYFVLNDAIDVNDGDLAEVSGALEKFEQTVNIQILEKEALCWLGADTTFRYREKFDEGKTVVLYDENSSVQHRCKVVCIDDEEFLVKLESSETLDENANYIITFEPVKYTIKSTKYDGEDCFEMVDYYGETIKFVNYGSASIIIKKCKNVECELHTAIFDLGSNLNTKTLSQISITPTSVTQGEFELGYETNSSVKLQKAKAYEGFDFENFDYKRFVFDTFSKNYVKRVFERNFNYIIFKFLSKSKGPFGIENASVVYSINNEIRRNT